MGGPTNGASVWPPAFHRGVERREAFAAAVRNGVAGGRRDRALPLLGDSVGITLANGVTLWAAAQAAGAPRDLPTAFVLELVVEALGGVSATPGGGRRGRGNHSRGTPARRRRARAALAAVILHRLLTFCLPALPGLLALRRLQAAVPADTGEHRTMSQEGADAGLPAVA